MPIPTPRPLRPPPRSTARSTAAPTRPCCGCSPRSEASTTSAGSWRKSRRAAGASWASATGSTRATTPAPKIIKRTAYEVFEITGKNPKIDIALELERVALQEDYFVRRRLYPNVDFYSGIIYEALGFPVGLFPVLFAVPRMSGWLAQWQEMLEDPEQKIARPKQLYLGYGERPVPAG